MYNKQTDSPRHPAKDAGYIDNMAIVAFQQVREKGLRHVNGAPEVDGKQPFKIFQFSMVKAPGKQANACVIDEDEPVAI